MQKIGSFLVIVSLLAIILDFFNRVPRILAWIYLWGDGAAWAIKIGLLVAGAALYLAGGRKEKQAS